MQTWLKLAMAVALFATSFGAKATDRPPPLPSFFMESLFEGVEQVKNGAKPTHGKRQRLSLVGRDDLIVEQVYSPLARPICEPLKRDGRLLDPIAEITSRARPAGRLVIVNEAHDDAQTRQFILTLLAPLHDAGFSVYAAETFTRIVGSKTPKWPLLNDGTYSYEPTFGEVIRKARALDFAFVPYEAELPPRAPTDDAATRTAARELAQSRNIMDRIVVPMPQARALIHVGHHHVMEGPVQWDKNEWMASRLKAASGIDPLTIDQTAFQSPTDRPVLCTLATDTEKGAALATDLAVALPKPVLRRSRPVWRRAGGQVDVAVPSRLRIRGIWSIVEARYAAEPAEAVPADRILLGPDEDLPLLLRPGKYRVEAWTREGGWSEAVEILVN